MLQNNRVLQLKSFEESFFDIGEAILNEEYDIIGKMFTVPHRQSLVVWLSVVTHAAVPVSAGCALPSHVLK